MWFIYHCYLFGAKHGADCEAQDQTYTVVVRGAFTFIYTAAFSAKTQDWAPAAELGCGTTLVMDTVFYSKLSFTDVSGLLSLFLLTLSSFGMNSNQKAHWWACPAVSVLVGGNLVQVLRPRFPYSSCISVKNLGLKRKKKKSVFGQFTKKPFCSLERQMTNLWVNY